MTQSEQLRQEAVKAVKDAQTKATNLLLEAARLDSLHHRDWKPKAGRYHIGSDLYVFEGPSVSQYSDKGLDFQTLKHAAIASLLIQCVLRIYQSSLEFNPHYQINYEQALSFLADDFICDDDHAEIVKNRNKDLIKDTYSTRSSL